MPHLLIFDSICSVNGFESLIIPLVSVSWVFYFSPMYFMNLGLILKYSVHGVRKGSEPIFSVNNKFPSSIVEKVCFVLLNFFSFVFFFND